MKEYLVILAYNLNCFVLSMTFDYRCTRGEMKMTGDEFSSTRQIIDVELNYAQSTKHRQKAHLSVIDAGIQDEMSSHGYADIDELNSDDYVNVKEELNNSDDDDEFDYENLRDGV